VMLLRHKLGAKAQRRWLQEHPQERQAFAGRGAQSLDSLAPLEGALCDRPSLCPMAGRLG
jgi:hypothetical protein